MKSLLCVADEYNRLGRRVMPLRENKKPLEKGCFCDHPYSEGQMINQPWDRATYIGLNPTTQITQRVPQRHRPRREP